MFSMGVPELIILGVIAVLLFGKRLPEVARSLGQSYHQFRSGIREMQRELDLATREAERPLYQRASSLPHYVPTSPADNAAAEQTPSPNAEHTTAVAEPDDTSDREDSAA